MEASHNVEGGYLQGLSVGDNVDEKKKLPEKPPLRTFSIGYDTDRRIIKYIGFGIILMITILLLLSVASIIKKSNHYETGIVTDKWTGSILGRTTYRFEIDNTTVVGVTDFDYYNIEIGDSYTYALIDIK